MFYVDEPRIQKNNIEKIKQIFENIGRSDIQIENALENALEN
jgi:hypothetical protein